MKTKKFLILLTIFLASICLFSLSNKVNAATISDDGKYALLLSSDEMEPTIDGEYVKLIRFNVADGETTVKVAELVKGIAPFNGQNEFSHWETENKEKVGEKLKLTDFKKEGNFYTSTGKEIKYTNGLYLSAKFEGKSLKETGNYYVIIDSFGGTLKGKAKLLIKSKAKEFKTIDLTKYTPVRKGYIFKGWDLDGKFVTSVNSSAFAKDAVVNLTATYTKKTFDSDYVVLKLNANGGTIEGKSSYKYDYVGGGNSGTSMSLLPYIPVRDGYTFNGWNTKKDGTGKKYKYMYWASWRNDESSVSEFERDTLNDDKSMYKNITLYATWTKNANTPNKPDQSTQETVKEIKSTGETKAKIEFAKEIGEDCELDIKPVEVKKNLADNNVKYVVDINLLENGQVVKVSDNKMKIKIALPEDLKGFKKYEVVYISNDEIKETIPAVVEDGYIVFETSHLSQYGIVATNVENKVKQTKNETNNPKTADNIITSVMLFVVSIITIGTLTVVNRKK